MPLMISARLRFGRYDAATSGWRQPEWPPNPGRLFCALVASATADDHAAALRWLERQPPPAVLAPGVLDQPEYQGYVPTNVTDAKGGSQLWPGRTNGERVRVSTLPAGDTVGFEWESAPPDDVTRALRRLCSRVPYLGRSTAGAAVWVDEDPVEHGALTRFAPTTLDRPGVDLTVPYAGYLDRLRELHERGGRAWEAARTRRYTAPAPTDGGVPGAPASSVEHVLILRVDGASVPGAHLPVLTTVLRRALMKRVADPIPAVLSGHDEHGEPLRSGLPHVGFLGLPHVGSPHATGALLGVALTLPPMDADERAAILRGVLAENGAIRLRTSALECTVRLVTDQQAPLTLRADRWIGRPRGHRTWVTATPAMLDHHPKGNRPLEEVIARGCAYAGLPRPAWVVAGRGPRISGAVMVDTRRLRALTGRPLRPLVHAAVRFTEPVRGPVVIGSMRALGLGLMLPLDDGVAGREETGP